MKKELKDFLRNNVPYWVTTREACDHVGNDNTSYVSQVLKSLPGVKWIKACGSTYFTVTSNKENFDGDIVPLDQLILNLVKRKPLYKAQIVRSVSAIYEKDVAHTTVYRMLNRLYAQGRIYYRTETVIDETSRYTSRVKVVHPLK
jgi:hypothetical protein